jgi:hypothetical protein
MTPDLKIPDRVAHCWLPSPSPDHEQSGSTGVDFMARGLDETPGREIDCSPDRGTYTGRE